MAVKLHQPVAGLNVGDTYSGPMEQFLLAQGYASSDADGNVDIQDVVTDATPANDPRLAENREAPGAATPVVKGVESAAPKPAVELDPSKATPLPPKRNTVVGQAEDADVTAANADTQKVVDPATVTKAPAPAKPAERTRIVGDKAVTA